jgi:hypothetical protein
VAKKYERIDAEDYKINQKRAKVIKNAAVMRRKHHSTKNLKIKKNGTKVPQ